MVIKKLNSMFHKHSRWVFGIFTIIIIVTFVFFFTPGQFGFGSGTGESATAGTAFGDKVTYGDLVKLRMPMYVLSGQRDMSWRQLFSVYCTLRKAESLGLAVSDNEVAEVLRRMPQFQVDGKFNLEKYRKTLSRMGVSEADFNNAFRIQLLMGKLGSSLNSGLVATEGEARDLYRQFNARFAVRAAMFKAAAFKGRTAPTADGIKKYFNANRAAYQIPGHFDVLVAEFPFARFAADAKRQVSPAELEKFYQLNKASFADKSGKVRAFSDVKVEVERRFADQFARMLARRAANKFAAEAYEKLADLDAAEREAYFRTAAVAAKIQLVDAKNVAFDAPGLGKIKSKLLIDRLGREAAGKLSDEIVGDSAVYYGFIVGRVETRPAEFSEVGPRVKADYVANLALNDARKAAETARTSLVAMNDVARREAEFGKLKDCELKNFGFSLFNQPAPDGLEGAAASVMELRPGEVGQIAPGRDAVVLALLVKRIPAAMTDFEKNKQQFIDFCRMGKLQLAEDALTAEFASQCRWLGPEEK